MKLLSSGEDTFVKKLAEISDELYEFTQTLDRKDYCTRLGKIDGPLPLYAGTTCIPFSIPDVTKVFVVAAYAKAPAKYLEVNPWGMLFPLECWKSGPLTGQPVSACMHEALYEVPKSEGPDPTVVLAALAFIDAFCCVQLVYGASTIRFRKCMKKKGQNFSRNSMPRQLCPLLLF